ncbi:MAG: hypothetical protein KY455_00110 [Euryarchaeota archaeon]|nr:hypothetical protein [Euryarchaeota archaeon]
MLELVLASDLADITADEFASAVYNIFFAALVFGAGWLLVQHMQMTHKLRDVEDRVKEVEDRVTNIKEDTAAYRDVAASSPADQEGSHGRS